MGKTFRWSRPVSRASLSLCCLLVLAFASTARSAKDDAQGTDLELFARHDMNYKRTHEEHLFARFSCLAPRESLPLDHLKERDLLVSCYVTEGPIWREKMFKMCPLEDSHLKLSFKSLVEDRSPGSRSFCSFSSLATRFGGFKFLITMIIVNRNDLGDRRKF